VLRLVLAYVAGFAVVAAVVWLLAHQA